MCRLHFERHLRTVWPPHEDVDRGAAEVGCGAPVVTEPTIRAAGTRMKSCWRGVQTKVLERRAVFCIFPGVKRAESGRLSTWAPHQSAANLGVARVLRLWSFPLVRLPVRCPPRPRSKSFDGWLIAWPLARKRSVCCCRPRRERSRRRRARVLSSRRRVH